MSTSAADDKARPPGQMVDIGDVQLHALIKGEGEPPVVMEAAIGDFCLTWALVQPEVATFSGRQL